MPKDQQYRIRQKLSGISDIPKDVVMGVPILTMVGHMELNIENYRGIIEYTESLVRIQTKEGQIRVSGKGIHVEYYTNDEMKVTGNIASIEYIN